MTSHALRWVSPGSLLCVAGCGFRAQADGDLVADGVCGILIAEKLGVTQPTISEHLKILSQAGLLTSKRVKQWTFYKRDEARISKIKRAIIARI
jgi:DNA-binding transcriptional ArsR family regulator